MYDIELNNFAEYMQEFLYGENGFYTKGGGAGRNLDYLTSPEVGDYFGYTVAAYIDKWYKDLYSGEKVTIVEVGSGPGSLCASISRANFLEVKNVEYILVDISPEHRKTVQEKLEELNPVFQWSVRDSIPDLIKPTLVIANELLDNLVFNIRYASEVRSLEKNEQDYLIPDHVGIEEFFVLLNEASAQCPDLSLLFFDYMKSISQMNDHMWVRLYHKQMRVVGVERVITSLRDGYLGDITADVMIEQVNEILEHFGFAKISFEKQSEWIRKYGVSIDIKDNTVGSSLYDQLQQLAQGEDSIVKQTSFGNEIDILTDEQGLGSFSVVTARRAI